MAGGKRMIGKSPQTDRSTVCLPEEATQMLAAAVKLTVVAGENLTVGSAVGCRLRV
jgi:hypothetical protein